MKPTICSQLALPFAESFREEWRPIVAYEGYYEVSSLGNVRSSDRVVPIPATVRRGPIKKRLQGRPMRLGVRGIGDRYKKVHLFKDGIGMHKSVHVIVLEAFVGVRPFGYVVNHRDGDPANNRLENLEWCTPSENNLHAVVHGLAAIQGEDHWAHKYTASQVRMVRALRREGMTLLAIATHCGMPIGSVHNIVSGRTWNHLPEE